MPNSDIFKSFDHRLIQNSLFCSLAVYRVKPYRYLKDDSFSKLHNLKTVVAAGDYRGEDEVPQRCLMVVSKDTLFVAFKGTESFDDWIDNAKIEKECNGRFCGSFHSGFHKRASIVCLEDIKKVADVYAVEKIVMCGHSLGGAVSSIVYLLLHQTTGE